MNRGHDKFKVNMKSKTSQKRTHGKLHTYRILKRILEKFGNKCRIDSTGHDCICTVHVVRSLNC